MKTKETLIKLIEQVLQEIKDEQEKSLLLESPYTRKAKALIKGDDNETI